MIKLKVLLTYVVFFLALAVLSSASGDFACTEPEFDDDSCTNLINTVRYCSSSSVSLGCTQDGEIWYTASCIDCSDTSKVCSPSTKTCQNCYLFLLFPCEKQLFENNPF